MDFFAFLGFVFMFAAVLLAWRGIKIVPQQEAWIVEYFGKFDTKLEPGLHFINPFFAKVAYKHTLKEMAVDVPEQAAITRDNVTLHMDGILYLRIIDPVAGSYGVTDPVMAASLLAQTTMRSEIGKLTLDKTFEEREALNHNIVAALNDAAQSWGIQCMRYEIKNIDPPKSVLKAMELQMAAEREKRATILESEGKRQSDINIAEGDKQQTILTAEGQQRETVLIAEARKQEVVLQSEAAQIDQINRAKGEAEAILSVADASAKGIEMIAASIEKTGGEKAVALKVAEQYVDAFKQLAKHSNTVLLPANANDVGGTVAQALSVFESIKDQAGSKGASVKGPWENK